VAALQQQAEQRLPGTQPEARQQPIRSVLAERPRVDAQQPDLPVAPKRSPDERRWKQPAELRKPEDEPPLVRQAASRQWPEEEAAVRSQWAAPGAAEARQCGAAEPESLLSAEQRAWLQARQKLPERLVQAPPEQQASPLPEEAQPEDAARAGLPLPCAVG
jgi:hypothetical protein